MPKYNVTLYCNAVASYQVDAEDEDEAKEKALQMNNEQTDQEFFAVLHVEAFELEDTLVDEVKQ